ncbi:PilW family protein [Lysobacter sp. CCNWLW3]|uniref:PilW family protein n=1 Tax=unclassified Lysobacter TaxID=2635362 RepID=UPI002FCF653A
MRPAALPRGFSLVELMISLVLGALLMLGLVQVFEASRITYKLSEGLSRVQENSRFAMDYLQRDLRMAGHMGCYSDQVRFLPGVLGFRSTFVAQTVPTNAQLETAPEPLQFQAAIQGFEAANTAPGDSLTLPAGGGAWAGSPALPAYVQGLTPAPMAGSDVVLLRYFTAESVPVRAATANTISVASAGWARLNEASGIANPGLFAVGSCQKAVAFQATAVSVAASGATITVNPTGLNRSDLSLETLKGSQLFRAESEAYYVALNAAGEPALYRARFTAAPGSGAVAVVGGRPEELVEGIENMQLIYGMDLTTDQTRAPSGYVARQDVARVIQPGGDRLPWRRVGMVQVAFLSRSTERAGVAPAVAVPSLLGLRVTPPGDGRYRSVYESSIALRNRLYGK